MKTVACIIARTNSKRLPQKVLKIINGKAMIEHIIENVKAIKEIDEIYICSSKNEEDKILEKIAEKNEIKFYGGSEKAVIERMLDVAEKEKAINVIRITGDNIFTDKFFLEEMLKWHKIKNVDYTRTEYISIGATAEIMKVDALKDCYKSINPDKSEYLFLYMFNPKKYKCLTLIPEEKYQRVYSSLTVDTEVDWKRTKFIFEKLKDAINYFNIIELNKKDKIPNFEIDKNIQIKLPDNEEISYYLFRKKLEEKILMSEKIYLISKNEKENIEEC